MKSLAALQGSFKSYYYELVVLAPAGLLYSLRYRRTIVVRTEYSW
jgi:hypothetical protein